VRIDLTPADDAVLYPLFAAVRGEELGTDAWDPSVSGLVLRQQFDARRRGYLAEHRDAREYLITVDGVAAGWGMLDRTAPAWRLIDIAVVKAWRGRGVATGVIRRWQREAAAAGCRVTLSVLYGNNAAQALYERLGFRVVAETATHLEMEWR